MAEAGVVRGDQVELVGQGRDQVAEHMRGGREAVQQQDRRGVLRTRLPVEDVQAVDVHGAVRYFRNRHVQLLVREGPSWAAAPRRPPNQKVSAWSLTVSGGRRDGLLGLPVRQLRLQLADAAL